MKYFDIKQLFSVIACWIKLHNTFDCTSEIMMTENWKDIIQLVLLFLQLVGELCTHTHTCSRYYSVCFAKYLTTSLAETIILTCSSLHMTHDVMTTGSSSKITYNVWNLYISSMYIQCILEFMIWRCSRELKQT